MQKSTANPHAVLLVFYSRPWVAQRITATGNAHTKDLEGVP